MKLFYDTGEKHMGFITFFALLFLERERKAVKTPKRRIKAKIHKAIIK